MGHLAYLQKLIPRGFFYSYTENRFQKCSSNEETILFINILTITWRGQRNENLPGKALQIYKRLDRNMKENFTKKNYLFLNFELNYF